MNDYDYSSSFMDNPIAFLGILFLIASIVSVVLYLWTLYPRYYMLKTAKVGETWMAFVPILNDVKFFNLAGKSGWWYLGYIFASGIPLIGGLISFIIICLIYWEVGARFGLGTFGKVLSIFLGYWVYWYVALTRRPYNGMGNPYSALAYTQQQDDKWYRTEQTAQHYYQQPGCNPELTNPNQNNKWQ